MNCGTGSKDRCVCGKYTTKLTIGNDGTKACCGTIIDMQGNFQPECYKVGWSPNSSQQQIQDTIRYINGVSSEPVKNSTSAYCQYPLIPRLITIEGVPLWTNVPMCVPESLSIQGVRLTSIKMESEGVFSIPPIPDRPITSNPSNPVTQSTIAQEEPTIFDATDISSFLNLSGITDTLDYFDITKSVGVKNPNNMARFMFLLIIIFIIVIIIFTGILMKWEKDNTKSISFNYDRLQCPPVSMCERGTLTSWDPWE